MDIDEAERVVVAKPVASRPNCSTFRSFSELLAGAINASSPQIESSQATVSAIRPKTVRFKPALNRTPAASVASQDDIFEAALCDSSHKSPNSDTKQSLIYKPMAKLVSRTTVSLLANMGNCRTIQQQSGQSMEGGLHHISHESFGTNLSSDLYHSHSITPPSETTEPCKMMQQNIEEDQKALTSAINCDRPSYDGYNWRKYGQKQVKGSEYPRSYYKCTHPNCPVKKKVERSFDGQIAEIVYKGEHNHPKPQPPKRSGTAGMQGSGMVPDGVPQDVWSNNHSERNDSRIENQNDTGLPANSVYGVKVSQPNDSILNACGISPENSCGLSGECEQGSKGFEAEEEESRSKRRRNESRSNEAAVSEEALIEPRIVLQSSTDSEIIGDGFRWRKYGQKVVKGNPYPRSYYRCTNVKCNVRKHVERAIDDPRAFVTTYEGKHNHEMPIKNINPNVPSERDSQASLSKDKP
ncbi:hypothetical protein HN51_015774 [Arachis hypogaea]|uniref:WRKY domain-containing protein n=1 Tax=Arachis hypogaea TaxID=3818 RepID=A0A445CJ04_ARAHY|nr:WRKY transcription factor 44 [Arachis hypogaea]XP_025605079.1 WRKY transcription factor 44 [Arachis hypogaea]QHO46264.1 WRKY transcription factor [Arachis hypogaea]QHO46265.1 WRKY transcription factor [Arachis hypogaea]RYR50903.1 hypothetical protein Ahy_A06g025918 [Arachis hypogaea]